MSSVGLQGTRMLHASPCRLVGGTDFAAEDKRAELTSARRRAARRHRVSEVLGTVLGTLFMAALCVVSMADSDQLVEWFLR